MRRSSPRAKRSRLNIRVPTELLTWLKDFATEKHTSVTQILIDHVTDLKEKNSGPPTVSG